MASLQSMLEYYKKGEQVKVTIEYRDGREYKTKDVTVTLGDKSVIETTQNACKLKKLKISFFIKCFVYNKEAIR